MLINTSVRMRYTYYQCWHTPYKIIIDSRVRAPGHGREVVYGLNATEKLLL